jgi:hypothetical protein
MANGEAKVGVNCSCKFGFKQFLIMMFWVHFELGSGTDLFMICEG